MYFVKLMGALSPNFERKQLLACLDDVFDRIENIRELSGMDSSVAAAMKSTFPSIERELQDVEGYRGNVLSLLEKLSTSMAAQRGTFYDYVEGLYAPDIMKDVFDYEKTNVMALINALTFFVSYSHTLMVNLAVSAASDGRITSVIDREDREMLLAPNNVRSFKLTLTALSTPLNEVQRVLKGLRHISYNADAPEEVRNVTNASPDPLKAGLMPVVGDLVYYIGVRVNEWRGYRHEARKEEILRLQQVVIYLERKKDNASKEELERIVKQINYHSGRINKLRAKVEMVEEKYR